MLAGDGLQLRPVVGDHVLVGGDHALARREGRRHERVGRFVAAHQLHDDIHVRVRDQAGWCVGHERAGHAARDDLVRVLVGDADESQADAVNGREPLGLLKEGADDRTADRACPEHADAERIVARHWRGW